jgi:hypothetical protein
MPAAMNASAPSHPSSAARKCRRAQPRIAKLAHGTSRVTPLPTGLSTATTVSRPACRHWAAYCRAGASSVHQAPCTISRAPSTVRSAESRIGGRDGGTCVDSSMIGRVGLDNRSPVPGGRP